MTLSPTVERQKAIDFSYTYFVDTVTFTAPLPTIQYFDSLLRPFDEYVWVSVIGVILAIIIPLMLINNNKCIEIYKCACCLNMIYITL